MSKDKNYFKTKYIQNNIVESTYNSLIRMKDFYFEYYHDEIDEQAQWYVDNNETTNESYYGLSKKKTFRTPYTKNKKVYHNIIIEDLELDDTYDLPYFGGLEIESVIYDAETRLGFKLPTSYRDFILNHGYFVYGYGNRTFEMIKVDYIVNIYDYVLKHHKIDLYNKFDNELVDYLKRLYPIAYQGTDHSSFYCFDIATQNINTTEMDIIYWKEDDWEANKNPVINSGKNFDSFISFLVDKKINTILR